MIGAWLSACYPDASAQSVQAWVRNIQSSCTAEALMAMGAMISTVSIEDVLAKVRARTLVMHARDDAVHPLTEGRNLAQGIPGAELCVIDSANHHPFPGMPGFEAFLDTLTGFLDE